MKELVNIIAKFNMSFFQYIRILNILQLTDNLKDILAYR